MTLRPANPLPVNIAVAAVILLIAFPIPSSCADTRPDPADPVMELLHRGEHAKALAMLEEDHARFPYDEGIRKRLAEAWTIVGRQRLDHNDFDGADAGFARALELYPERGDLMTLRGIALYGGKQYDHAAVLLDQALQSGGDSAATWFYLGRTRYDTGDLAGALGAWDHALAMEPGNEAVRALAEKARRETVVEKGMARDYRSQFVISYDEGKMSDLADRVLETLEAAYSLVGSDFDYYPSVPVPVILYTRRDYRIVTTGPEWSGGIYDGKIRLPVGGARELTPTLRGVLNHEYTHVVVREMTKGNCPTWLNEGLAMMEEQREARPPAQKAGKGGPLHISVLNGPFLSLGSREAALAYRQSFIMARHLVTEYGWHKVREVLVNLGTGLAIDAAVSKAFADYGLDYSAIMQELLGELAGEGDAGEQ